MFVLSFFVVALLVLDVPLVTARPRRLFQKRSPIPTPVIEGLNTNAKRFAAGLPPLPPVRRMIGSKVDTARRQSPSLVPRAGQIEVLDSSGKKIGYLEDTLTNGHFTVTSSQPHGDIFAANLFVSGTTYPVNFKDADTSDKYLAGLIRPSTTLTSNSGFATLGLSSQVPAGPPQVNNPSISGDPSETAIWSYDAASGSVTGIWSTQSSSFSLTIWYDDQTNTVYLTGSSANAPTNKSEKVTFIFIPS